MCGDFFFILNYKYIDSLTETFFSHLRFYELFLCGLSGEEEESLDESKCRN